MNYKAFLVGRFEMKEGRVGELKAVQIWSGRPQDQSLNLHSEVCTVFYEMDSQKSFSDAKEKLEQMVRGIREFQNHHPWWDTCAQLLAAGD